MKLATALVAALTVCSLHQMGRAQDESAAYGVATAQEVVPFDPAAPAPFRRLEDYPGGHLWQGYCYDEHDVGQGINDSPLLKLLQPYHGCAHGNCAEKHDCTARAARNTGPAGGGCQSCQSGRQAAPRVPEPAFPDPAFEPTPMPPLPPTSDPVPTLGSPPQTSPPPPPALAPTEQSTDPPPSEPPLPRNIIPQHPNSETKRNLFDTHTSSRRRNKVIGFRKTVVDHPPLPSDFDDDLPLNLRRAIQDGKKSKLTRQLEALSRGTLPQP